LLDQAASERLFSALSYAVFVAPAVVVVMWMTWRVMGWCLFHATVVLGRVFPGLAVEQGQAPRLFAPNTSAALSHVFLFCVALPLVFVPMRYLADRLEGPKILFWHWLLVLGSLGVLVIWLIARLRRKQDWRSRL